MQREQTLKGLLSISSIWQGKKEGKKPGSPRKKRLGTEKKKRQKTQKKNFPTAPKTFSRVIFVGKYIYYPEYSDEGFFWVTGRGGCYIYTKGKRSLIC